MKNLKKEYFAILFSIYIICITNTIVKAQDTQVVPNGENPDKLEEFLSANPECSKNYRYFVSRLDSTEKNFMNERINQDYDKDTNKRCFIRPTEESELREEKEIHRENMKKFSEKLDINLKKQRRHISLIKATFKKFASKANDGEMEMFKNNIQELSETVGRSNSCISKGLKMIFQFTIQRRSIFYADTDDLQSIGTLDETNSYITKVKDSKPRFNLLLKGAKLIVPCILSLQNALITSINKSTAAISELEKCKDDSRLLQSEKPDINQLYTNTSKRTSRASNCKVEKVYKRLLQNTKQSPKTKNPPATKPVKPENPDRDRVCCMAVIASCEACKMGITIKQFCGKNPLYEGCPQEPECDKYCGDVKTGKCISCQESISHDEVCRLYPGIEGCPCCKEKIASCLACQKKITPYELCTNDPSIPGCKPTKVCCEAETASCYACAENLNLEDYCLKYPKANGCPLGFSNEDLVENIKQTFTSEVFNDNIKQTFSSGVSKDNIKQTFSSEVISKPQMDKVKQIKEKKEILEMYEKKLEQSKSFMNEMTKTIQQKSNDMKICVGSTLQFSKDKKIMLPMPQEIVEPMENSLTGLNAYFKRSAPVSEKLKEILNPDYGFEVSCISILNTLRSHFNLKSKDNIFGTLRTDIKENFLYDCNLESSNNRQILKCSCAEGFDGCDKIFEENEFEFNNDVLFKKYDFVKLSLWRVGTDFGYLNAIQVESKKNFEYGINDIKSNSNVCSQLVGCLKIMNNKSSDKDMKKGCQGNIKPVCEDYMEDQMEKIEIDDVIDEIYMDDKSPELLEIDEPDQKFIKFANDILFNNEDGLEISPDIINKVNMGLANYDNVNAMLRFLNSDDSLFSDIIEKDPKCNIPNSVTPDDEIEVEGSTSTKVLSAEEFDKRVEQDSKEIVENKYVVESVSDSEEIGSKIVKSEIEIGVITGENNNTDNSNSKYINYSIILLLLFLVTLM
jgi:hypothetical protein